MSTHLCYCESCIAPEYTVTYSKEDFQYVGLHSAYPSLSWLADTSIEALKGIVALVEDLIERQADIKAVDECQLASRPEGCNRPL